MTTPLRRAREQRQLTIQQLATAAEMDPGNLSRIERGIQVPSKGLAEKLARVLEGTVSEIEIIYPERFPVQPSPVCGGGAAPPAEAGQGARVADGTHG
ncbi:helix-turn-helix domain-containing protein [Achromobacter xylosoxidans]|uniref:Helix-turn-helix family protein 6 n=1 Tax=Achromobacter xylosoxidans (strain A8) TaxID=762376 RepID=E3HGP0_ACHXA|nr:helix-turn-helix transcriptional regulator [Achromobacter xylosoxidans]ADP15376.1 helix-turn-helix family protein 6 [Achromobacter xylosoxidans A8]